MGSQMKHFPIQKERKLDALFSKACELPQSLSQPD
jgi:hypothetical protein